MDSDDDLDDGPRTEVLRDPGAVRAARAVGGVAARTADAAVLHGIFEARVDVRPGAAAVVESGSATTYLELDRAANRLARFLRARGVRRGDRVGVLLDRSLDAYTAVLGILKAGAAYVPLDPSHPRKRTGWVLEDCGAAALVTTAALERLHQDFRGPVVLVDADRDALAAANPARLPRDLVGAGPHDLCWVIYTSGSTGRPKGVAVEHRSAVHLVGAEGELFRVRPGDRVHQGFSLAFDASVEEIWLAFRAGATLLPASPGVMRSGPDLAGHLARERVTVLSCVPSLLQVVEEDVPSIRLLILGGEACPPRLVERWARPGRRIVNTYGPTEATVIATWAELRPGRPVTIGRPLEGYEVRLLDHGLRPVAPGETGEICIGGVGVARGYVGHAASDEERFVPDPFAAGAGRMYRTGDLGRLDGDGNIEFLGRADGQVKIRGFRVELGEIEAAILEADGVLAAACAIREDATGSPRLAAYVVIPRGTPFDPESLRAALKERLPAYMVPADLVRVEDLPRLPSGKLDRAALPAPPAPVPAPATSGDSPRTDAERTLSGIWEELFRPAPVPRDANFFTGLGGHSLLAARMVSALRRVPGYAHVSVADVYDHPTIAALAAALESRARAPERRAAPAPEAAPRSNLAAGLLQLPGLYLVFALRGLLATSPFLAYFLLAASGVSAAAAAAWAAAVAAAAVPASLAAAVAAKWILVGRLRPGRYPLWGWFHVRWWLATTLVRAAHPAQLARTPLLPLFYRLLGARIGRDVHLATDRLSAFDLVSIGDGTSVDEEVSLFGWEVVGGELVLAPIRIGRECRVGTRANLGLDTVVGDGARLEDLSLLPAGGRVPAGETWEGSPARPGVPTVPGPPPRVPRGTLARAAAVAAYALAVVLLPVALLAAFVPGLALLVRIDPFEDPLLYLAAMPVAGGAFILVFAAEVVVLKRLLVGRVRPCSFPEHGTTYFRHWVADQLVTMSLDHAGQVRATLYLPPWYRALGARLGKFVELSTATSAPPDLLTIDDGGTIADEASVGSPRTEGGWTVLQPTRIGRRAFVGNSASVRAGAEMGDGSLVGVLSISPAAPADAARPGAAWLGSPPIALPRREPSAAFPDSRTYAPGRGIFLARAAFEILRVTLPSAGHVAAAAATVTAVLALWEGLGPVAAPLLLPVAFAAACAAVVAAVVLAKWILMGRYRPFVRPLWTPFVWRLELSNALYEFLAAPLALEPLQGTPLLPWVFRLLGARVGRGVYANTTGLIEFDLVEIGDRVALNEDCVVQSHLFEDRVLKASGIRIGADCSVGADSVVLYDSEMEPGARLDALSLVMKGERLPARTGWAGVPARRVAGEDRAPGGGHGAGTADSS
jgi:non-ribosomal peptide synthetase-like protein